MESSTKSFSFKEKRNRIGCGIYNDRNRGITEKFLAKV
mgnify:CR=1 FL=1